MEAAGSSVTVVPFYQTARRRISEDNILHLLRSEESHEVEFQLRIHGSYRRWTAMFLVFSWLLTLSAAFSTAEKQICTYSANFRVTSADCSRRMLENVPSSLPSGIQALSMTHNRIRVLHSDSFKCYTHLKYLYLDDNMISYVENGTFEPLQNLEVIRLSHNELETVPIGVLQLPKLRKLYVDGNRLTGGGGFEFAPTSETLELLSLANCHLENLPPLWMYPKLLQLNISGNELKVISPQQIAPMCRLHLLDLRGNPMLFNGSGGCECHLLATWIEQMNIYYAEVPLNCSSDTDMWTDGQFPCEQQPQDMMQQPCRAAIVREEKKTNIWLTWILPSALLVACLYIIVLLIGTRFQSLISTKCGMEHRTGNIDL